MFQVVLHGHREEQRNKVKFTNSEVGQINTRKVAEEARTLTDDAMRKISKENLYCQPIERRYPEKEMNRGLQPQLLQTMMARFLYFLRWPIDYLWWESNGTNSVWLETFEGLNMLWRTPFCWRKTVFSFPSDSGK
jgi:hypothetical protein